MRTISVALACLLLLLWQPAAHSSFLHAPHNETNGITCVTCHEYPLADEMWPPDYPPANPTADDTFRNFLCLRCHDGSNAAAPTEALHSSLVVQGSYTFTTQCVTCHDPHFQEQLQWVATNFDDLYLVTGQITGLIVQNNTTIIGYANLNTDPNWSDPAKWAAKTGPDRGLVFVANALQPQATFEVVAADNNSITINGVADLSLVGNTFGLIYGQLIRYRLDFNGVAVNRPVKFFDPTTDFTDAAGAPAPGGFVDKSGSGAPQGICQVCHTQTDYWRTDGGEPVADHPTTTVTPDCTTCHKHPEGFKPTGMGPGHGPGQCATGSQGCSQCHNSGRHANHLDIGIECMTCHDTCSPVHDGSGQVLFKDGAYLDATTVCDSCHKNPSTGGPPNDTGYRTGWSDANFTLGCDGCHNGRPSLDALVMNTNAHDRLVGEAWIRQYPCWFCHYDTVDSGWHLQAAHANGQVDIVIDPQWYIAGSGAPTYDPTTKTCGMLYCHSDGTTVNPETRQISWADQGHKQCNACHGHDPAITNCNAAGCHNDGRDGTYWDQMPAKRWLTAMPMYQNTGPGTSRANSHFRHLFTGYSCDDCHAATVAGGSCTDCHGTTVPTGKMNETAHVNAAYHVNRNKDIVFKNGGTYDPVNKSCSATACHTGATPQWGDTVDNIPCRDCHGTTGPDVDDFGKFNGTQAKINLTQWETTGHGRPASAGPYPQTGNPPADFPEKGCWYCHDNQVLHQDTGNPFRLREHRMFKERFKKECVFCHMRGEDDECVTCHNTTEPTLAPQLADIAADTAVNPPYTRPRPDHSGFVAADGTILDSCQGCHPDDDHRHKTGYAQSWTEDQKEDIENNYVRMGVCLICHDDDSTGECAQCHQGPQYTLGFDPGLPGTGYITATQAKASSMHFGYKHYQAYLDSLANDLASGTATDAGLTAREIVDSTQAWTDDQWIDKYVFVTSGANAGLSRLITKNTGDRLFVDPPFPNGPVAAGDTYVIRDVVWKGGKFCWDCHDPHGDANIFMIQDEVSIRTGGRNGKPVERKAVVFTRRQSGSDYARTEAPYDGICNVCHDDPDQHYGNGWGDGHNQSRRCTQCHEHRFTDSHASGNTCTTCHRARPVPRHTGFSLPRDCTKCHAGTINGRMSIMGQFSANSHHVQGVEVTGKKCYACHWEATELGLINLKYHQGFNYKTYESVSGGPVDLVIWSAEEAPGVDDDPSRGSRPTVYDPDGTAPDNTSGKPTVTQFTAANLALGHAAERAEIAKITPACLGCHSDQNNDSQPFGDCKTPRQYSWDGTSIAARYTNTGTTTWGKYVDNGSLAPKDITKAFSAHGNAVANGGGWDPNTGVDAAIPNTRAGTDNVQCFDCHQSHGSKAVGVTTSYVTFNGTHNGGNLKETQAGKGGYAMTYAPTSNPDPNAINHYNTGAGLCFDCHETETAGATPWGYNSTFGASAPIIGYNDNPRFYGSYPSGRFPWRANRHTLGGHMQASNKNPESPNYDPAYQVQAVRPINGLCTACHDPHGVSPSLGDDMAYAVPLLKGTWLTSPYKEDTAPTDTSNYHRSSAMLPTWRTDRLRPPWSSPGEKVFANGAINEDENRFAGLCLSCHPKDTLTDGVAKNSAWKTVDRIHESVKGWGNNAEHNYPCSKCHQPHASGLPRLLRTNCLDAKHRGGVESGGAAARYSTSVTRTFPTGGKDGVNWRPACHESSAAGGGAWNEQEWNSVSPW